MGVPIENTYFMEQVPITVEKPLPMMSVLWKFHVSFGSSMECPNVATEHLDYTDRMLPGTNMYYFVLRMKTRANNVGGLVHTRHALRATVPLGLKSLGLELKVLMLVLCKDRGRFVRLL